MLDSEEPLPIVLSPEKTQTLTEFIYTFQKMGHQITLPTVQGVKDYNGARVTHVIVQAS
jgi:hypothetical protein